jgi:GNAT superfamily N-acetyltransferase
MRISIRPADLDSDQATIVALVRDNLSNASTDRRYQWLYRENPQGQADAWIAVDEDSGRAVGTAAAFPRRVFVRGKPEICWNLGDFAVDRTCRSLGPALTLQRACVEPVSAGRVGFCYDLPGKSMVPVYQRMGIAPVGSLVRFTRLLRLDRPLERRLKVGMLARPLSRLGNWLLSMSGPRRSSGKYEVEEHCGAPGDEFDELFKEVSANHAVCGDRSKEYLQWRYVANPLFHFRTMVARRGGRLCGYAIFTLLEEDAVVFELFGHTDPDLVAALTQAVVGFARDRISSAVNIPLLESSHWIPALRQVGFVPRETFPFLVRPSPDHPFQEALTKTESWLHTFGDVL